MQAIKGSLFNRNIQKRKEQGCYRQLQILTSPIDFASNDYLGMARSKSLFIETLNAWVDYSFYHSPMGSTGSRLISGHSPLFDRVEKEIATFHQRESCLLFPCGFMANIGLLSCLAREGDTIFFDSGIHASMRTGIKLSPATSYPFRHNDLTHLEQRLSSFKGRCFVCIESLYSTDGSLAPLKESCLLCLKYGAMLIVDEAHAMGLFGSKGQGLVGELGLEKQVLACIYTYGKALGIQGGCIVGPSILKEHLVNFCAPFIYSTAMAPVQVLSIEQAYRSLVQMDSARVRLQERIDYFDDQMEASFPSHARSKSPIKAIVLPGKRLDRAIQALSAQGISAGALRSPTVKRGNETLRLCLHSYNSHEEINLLIRLLKEAG